MKQWFIATMLVAVVAAVIGCGGGGGGSSSGGGNGDNGGNGGNGGNTGTFARPKVSITWGPRSKALDAPSSALSAVVLFKRASRSGADVSLAVDRSGPVEGSTVVYTGTEDVKVATTEMTVRFFAQTGGGGDLVGTASGNVPITTDGTVTTNVSTQGTVSSVQVPGGQVLTVGETRPLNFGARDAQNNLVAITPGSATWAVTNGQDKLTIANGDATGVAQGNAQVTATVDGKTSTAITVSVTDPASITVSVSPSSLSLAPSATQQFSAQVNGTDNPAVTWSVVEAGGGTITPGGLYTAPTTTGTFTVKATSVANPDKSATAVVQVQRVEISLSPTTAKAARGGTVQFSATVTGTANQNVTWSVVEAGGGSVSNSGLYTAPNAAGTYTVRATSQANTAVFGESKVTVDLGEFLIIGRSFGPTDEFPYIPHPYQMSADGSTIIFPDVAPPTNKPGYWTKATGFTQLPFDSNLIEKGLSAVSYDGSYIIGTGTTTNSRVRRAFRWHRSGAVTRVRAVHPDTPSDPAVTAISDNGQSVYGDDGSFPIRWTEAGGAVNVAQRFFEIHAVSSDEQVYAGYSPTEAVNLSSGALWINNGSSGTLELMRPASGPLRFLSSDGQAAATNFGRDGFYWTRSGGRHTFIGGSVIYMSRNGKYVIYQDDVDTYIWSQEKGAVPIRQYLESAGGPKDVHYATPHHMISADGTYVAGVFAKSSDPSAPQYVYYCRLPAPP